MVGKGLHAFFCVILVICVVLVFRRASHESGPHFVCTHTNQIIYSLKPRCSVLDNKVNSDRWGIEDESEAVSLCRRIGMKQFEGMFVDVAKQGAKRKILG